MAEIELTKGRVAIVDECDFAALNGFSWCAAGKADRLYAQTSYQGDGGKIIKVAMHRLIAMAPKGMVVDHINGNTLDNRSCNLRVVTQQENTWNRRARGMSGLNGVKKIRDRWIAQIAPNGVEISLGTYQTKEEAAAAYDIAASRVYGQFARLNGASHHGITLESIVDDKKSRIARIMREIEILTVGA